MKYAYLAGLPVLWTVLGGCSPAVDPLAKAGAHFQIDFPQDASVEGTCGTTGVGGLGADKAANEFTRAGPPDLPVAGSSIEPTNLGSPVVDGKSAANEGGRYEVDCKVKDNGSTFSISARMEGPNTSPLATEMGLAALNLTATVDSTTGDGTGRVNVNTTTTSNVAPNMDCNIHVLTDPEDASKNQIRAGRANFTFVCIDTTGALDEFGHCETRGTVVLENCAKD